MTQQAVGTEPAMHSAKRPGTGLLQSVPFNADKNILLLLEVMPERKPPRHTEVAAVEVPPPDAAPVRDINVTVSLGCIDLRKQ
jgi:hypothetical protein